MYPGKGAGGAAMDLDGPYEALKRKNPAQWPGFDICVRRW
jgi:hypothetical protein